MKVEMSVISHHCFPISLTTSGFWHPRLLSFQHFFKRSMNCQLKKDDILKMECYSIERRDQL